MQQQDTVYPPCPNAVDVECRSTFHHSPVSDHVTRVLAFLPDCFPKSHVFFVHNTSDNIDRHQDFAKALASYGHAVTLFDLRGHGESPVYEQYGFFAPNEGWERQIIDLASVLNRNDRPTVPTIIVGDGMGALFTLAYLKRNPSQISGTILLGPCGPWPKMHWASVRTGVASFFDPISPGLRFDREIHRVILEASGKGPGKFNWFNSRPKEIDRYLKTPHCGKALTKRGYFDLVMLVLDVYAYTPWLVTQRRLPIQIFYGGDDPLKNIPRNADQRVLEFLRQRGYQETRLKYFANSRHDLLFDKNAKEVFSEIVEFCEQQAERTQAL